MKKVLTPVFLLIIISLLIFLMLPLKEQTSGDDYFYAYSVKKSLETGQFQISEASTAAQVFPIIWAMLFSSFFGFSYETLHLSTLVFSPVILITAYFLIKQFGINSRLAFTASLFFISVPFVFQYALTFLTDLPFLALALLALLFFAKGLKHDRSTDLLLASLLSSMAFLTRQIGIFLPIGAFVAYLFTSKKVALSKKLTTTLAISAVPFLTVIAYILIFRQGSVSQYNMARNVANTLESLFFMKSVSSATGAWSDTIYETLEFLWLAFGLFSLFVITLILSNIKRYFGKKLLKPLIISFFIFAALIFFEKIIYKDQTYLGFPLLLYRYEGLFPMVWPYIWKYLVLFSFAFLSTETLVNLKKLKITRNVIFLSISFLLITASTAITGPDPKRYVMPLLPFMLIYLCFLSKNLKLSALITIPVLLLALIDSLQMTKLRYDTNALAQQKALELVQRGINFDRVLPNLEHTWSLWYTIEQKYAEELEKAGGDRLKVKYPKTPDNQDIQVISENHLKYTTLPKNYLLIDRTPVSSLFVNTYLITIKKL